MNNIEVKQNEIRICDNTGEIMSVLCVHSVDDIIDLDEIERITGFWPDMYDVQKVKKWLDNQ